MNQELFGVYDDQDIKTIHLVKAYAALAVIGILGWAYIKWDSERVHPNKFIVHFFYFFWINLFKIFSSFVSIKKDEAEIPDEVYQYIYGKSYYQLKDDKYGFDGNLKR